MWLLTTISYRSPRLVSIAEAFLEPRSNGSKAQVQYAILSHRWEHNTEEINFDEMRSQDYTTDREGFFKLDNARKQARRDGFEYVWLDTCCIDKKSSAELQEAINSMYHYYERAAICYVYLNDVKLEDLDNTFSSSKWFTRGWTLQELLAPSQIKFYDKEWRFLGTKRSLAKRLVAATNIPRKVLSGEKSYRDCSIAQRMSWASKRTTSRIEDIAYSLLGLFDVYMPLLYGERTRAFLRLQEEIMKRSDDQTIFVWQGSALTHSSAAPAMPGMLATSPADFDGSRDVYQTPRSSGGNGFGMTNRGLAITLSLWPWTADTYLAILDATGHLSLSDEVDDPSVGGVIGIFLRRLTDDDAYARVEVEGRQLFTSWEETVVGPPVTWLASPNIRRHVAVNVPQTTLPSSEQTFSKDRIDGFRLSGTLFLDNSWRRSFDLGPNGHRWSADTRILYGSFTRMPKILISNPTVTVKLGFDKHFHPTIFICKGSVPDEPTPYDLWSGKKDVKILRGNGRNSWTAQAWFRETEMNEGVEWHRRGLTIDQRTRVYANNQYPHLWLLKGHRLLGLDVNISHGYHADLLSRHGFYFELLQHVQISREEASGKLVWSVSIDAFPATSGTTEHIDHLLPEKLRTSARLKNGDATVTSSNFDHIEPLDYSKYGFPQEGAYELPG